MADVLVVSERKQVRPAMRVRAMRPVVSAAYKGRLTPCPNANVNHRDPQATAGELADARVRAAQQELQSKTAEMMVRHTGAYTLHFAQSPARRLRGKETGTHVFLP